MELEGKVALVTGAAGGIGTALVDALDHSGARVVGVDLDDGDITDPAAVEEIVRRTETEHGALDILVNNAGGYETPIFPDAPLEHWSRTLDLNLRAVLLGIHFAVPALERRGGGAIVNVASSAGLGFGAYEGAPEYAAAKAGVVRLTACLVSLLERRIRVNCVCPHTVATPAVVDAIATAECEGSELPQALRDEPLQLGEVTEAVLRLLADESLAGRVLVLRGGEEPRLLTAA